MKKTLVDTVGIILTPLQKRRLHIIDNHDFSIFLKHAEKEIRKAGGEPTLNPSEAEYALKQYYALATLNPNNMHAVSVAVDPYWHSHILHTKSYAQFCQDGIGYYMHHDPLDETDIEKGKLVEGIYEYTLKILDTIFPNSVNLESWPKDALNNRICWHFGSSTPQESVFPTNELTRVGMMRFA
ncbi:MAG: hypothetical protein WDZ88_02075 [Candidatus Paceibacterota bacterium]